MAEEPFLIPVAGAVGLRVSTRSGRVTIRAEQRSDIAVESGRASVAESSSDGRQVALSSAGGGSGRIDVRCPAGTDITVGTASGQVDLQGRFGEVRVTSASGSIHVDRAARIDLRSASGNVEVGQCDGACRIQTMAGRASVGQTVQVAVSTVSGMVRVDSVAGAVQVNTASGRVEVGSGGGGDITVKTMSGGVTVRLARGIRPALRLRSLGSRPRSDCEEGNDLQVAISSLSGKIEVVPA